MVAKSSAGLASEAQLELLKSELEGHDDSAFERLSAHLVSRLLSDVAVTVSKSGYQVGGDAGTAGLRGRRLRIECKRYRESTRLSSRDLAGEVAESASEDELLEAWILMATKAVRENERNLALKQGQSNGIAVVIIDWTQPANGAGICSLGALCATWPHVVGQHLGTRAADAARSLAPWVGAAVDNLRKDLEVWHIGYERLREASHRHLKALWESRQQSRAYLNQDAAGGAPGVHLIARNAPLRELTRWWSAPDKLESPAVITGLEGVGKTWTALGWAQERCGDLPIVLVVPSGTFAKRYDISVGGIQEFLADALKGHTHSSLTDKYWRTRVTRLLARPVTEGPVFFLLLDGLNQHPRTNWVGVAQALQADALRGHTRVLMTCRESYFDQELRQLAQIEAKAVLIPVHVYDDSEFEEILRLHGMRKDELHPTLHVLARTPRLFPLVCRLKDQDALKSDASIPRLLFEYGRDVLSQREGSAFTSDQWVQWLAERARYHYKRIKETRALSKPEPPRDLEGSVASPALTPDDVQRRLSDLVDGHLFEKKRVGATTHWRLRDEAALLGLALALLETLDTTGGDFDAQQAALEEWLEPIGAIDQTTEVLRAALAVILAGAGTDGEVRTDCLLFTWISAQNPSRTHEQDVSIFGSALPRSMLVVIERSSNQAHGTAHRLAIQSLRKLPKTRVDDWRFIRERLIDWCGRLHVPRPVDIADSTRYPKATGLHEEMLKRIGSAEPGERVVLGVRLQLAYGYSDDPAAAIPRILEGHDLTQFRTVLRTATVREAAQVVSVGRIWAGLYWLVSVASADESRTRELLIQLADELLATPAEPGVHPHFANRAAALLLRLGGDESLDIRASQIDWAFGTRRNYIDDYEKDPAHSLFAAQRQHVELILKAEDVPVWRRLEKVDDFIPDPTIEMPDAIVAALAASLEAQTFAAVHEGVNRTIEDHRWEKLQSAAARFLPGKFFETSKRQLQVLASRRGEQKYWSAVHLSRLLLVVAPEDVPALAGLRNGYRLEHHEEFANTCCLQLEILHLAVEEQLEYLLDANQYLATTDLLEVIRPATADQLGRFLEKHKASGRAERIVLEVMALQQTQGAAGLAEKLLHTLESQEEELRNISFMALSLCAPEACGQRLLSQNWKADGKDAFASGYGSDAVAHASKAFSLEDVLPLIAPWRWLNAALVRGSQPSELELVSVALVRLAYSTSYEISEPPAELALQTGQHGALPRIRVSQLRGETPEPEWFRRMGESAQDLDRRMEEISREAAASIRKARVSGHSLYLQAFDVSAVRAAYGCAPAEWDRLLEGAGEQTADFVKRVRSAEPLYMALCEALLELAPDKGALLWAALPAVMRTKMKGAADISEFVHMVFRAPDSPEVERLRETLTSFAATSTDLAIQNLVIAAQCNGRDDWLDKLIQQDRASSYNWRRQRGIMLDAFRSYSDPGALEWPSGWKATSFGRLESSMVNWRIRGALSRLWWSKFVKTTDTCSAFGAWNMFLACVDRRAWAWMENEMVRASTGSDLDRLRALHVQMNRDQLESRFSSREEKIDGLSKQLFGYEAPAHWLEMDAIAG